jgi:hypothetical protein
MAVARKVADKIIGLLKEGRSDLRVIAALGKVTGGAWQREPPRSRRDALTPVAPSTFTLPRYRLRTPRAGVTSLVPDRAAGTAASHSALASIIPRAALVTEYASL